MYGTGVALAVHEQRVSFYIFVCVIAFEGVLNWCLTQYEVVILPTCVILLSKYTTMSMTALRLLNLWNNGCRVGPKLPTARTFVLVYVCA